MTESLQPTATGAIIYDPEVLQQVSPRIFSPDGWEQVTPVAGSLKSSGRGSALFVSDAGRDFVLRPYLRGGLVGRLIKRAYVWNGADRTRSFAEWRLLAKMRALDLPVPQPAAAHYARSGPFYSAGLITLRLPGIRSLVDRLLAAPGDAGFWNEIGVTIGQFHAAGVNHADLNAYNLQLDSGDKPWLLDFDRGRISSAGPWRQQNIARLHRSLQKSRALAPALHFGTLEWEQLLDGYFSVSRSA